MIKNVLPIALLGLCLINGTSCKNSGGFKKTKSGLEYQIVRDEPGTQKPQPGDFVEINVIVRTKDTVLMDSRKNMGKPVEFQMQHPQPKGDPIEGIMLMTKGDSAVFRIPIDSMIKPGQPLPPFLKKGGMMEYDVVLVSIKTLEEKKAEDQVKVANQKGFDDSILQDYFTKNNIHPSKTASGLYYSITKEGSGNTPQKGQSVTVNYTGKTMDGMPFDSNVDTNFHHKQPFTVALGQGRVIPGWDEGLALLKKGSKATLYIPSTLAYGPQSPTPKIAPNSILIFDVEVTDIKDAKPEANVQMTPQMNAHMNAQPTHK